MLGKKFYLLTVPELKRFHVVCPWLHAATVEETHDEKATLGLWMTLTNCASEWMESLTSPQGVWTPCLPP